MKYSKEYESDSDDSFESEELRGRGYSVPRAVKQRQHKLAVLRAEQMPNGGPKKGGFVHRPMKQNQPEFSMMQNLKRPIGRGKSNMNEDKENAYWQEFKGGFITPLHKIKKSSKNVEGNGKIILNRKQKKQLDNDNELESQSEDEIDVIGSGRRNRKQMKEKKGRDFAGGSVWSDFADGFKRGFNTVTKPVLHIASKIPGTIGVAANVADTARETLLGNDTFGGAKKMDGRMRRALIVKKVMKKLGCSLADASKIVKEKGLYKK